MTPRAPAALALAYLYLLTPARAFSDCPQSCISFASPSCTTLPVRSASTSGGHGYGPASGSYNLPAGTLRASGFGSGGYGGGAEVDARDLYHVTGLPAGTPLTFTALLDVYGSSSQSGFMSGTLLEGASNQQTFSASNPGEQSYSASTTLVVTINRLAGEEFQITSSVIAGSGQVGSATTSAALHFWNLPQGTQIVSCQGFTQDFPVPTLPASWGSLKAHYR